MKRILNFQDFINEASFALNDPKRTGEEFNRILMQTRDIKEIPSGSNKGPDVEKYLQSVGLGAGQPWCQAYVYWALSELAKKMGTTNPAPKGGTVKGHWENSSKENRITAAEAKSNPSLIKPGMVFIMQRNTPWNQGGWEGHTGIILSVNPDKKLFTSIEGNTDEKATGEGNKVGINTRPLDSGDMIGYIDWFKGQRTPEFEMALSSGVPSSGASTAGQITGQLGPVTREEPSQSTVGDEEAEAAAYKADSQPAQGLAAYLLRPWRPDQAKGAEVTQGEVRKFLGRATEVEKLQASKPAE